MRLCTPTPGYFDFIPYTPVPPSDLTARGSRRQIASIYSLPIDLIDRHLIHQPYNRKPYSMAPDTIVVERKPVDLTNSRIACRHSPTSHRRAAQGAPTHTTTKANPNTSKQFNRRGRHPLSRRLSDTPPAVSKQVVPHRTPN